MKNQYFGDIRDLFKYDLIEQILNQLDARQFAFIPMITGREKKHGENREFEEARENGRPGTKNEKLRKFLEEYNSKKKTPNDRNVKDIKMYFENEKYFGQKKIKVEIYDDGPFEHGSRKEYFTQLISSRKELLSSLLIFIDPDIGLEVEKSSEKHLLYDEIEKLYRLKSPNSILMIYQNLPRDRGILEYLPSGRAKSLQEKIQPEYLPLYISDNEICFLFLTENKGLGDELVKILRKYIDRYKDFFTKLKISNVSQD